MQLLQLLCCISVFVGANNTVAWQGVCRRAAMPLLPLHQADHCCRVAFSGYRFGR